MEGGRREGGRQKGRGGRGGRCAEARVEQRTVGALARTLPFKAAASHRNPPTLSPTITATLSTRPPPRCHRNVHSSPPVDLDQTPAPHRRGPGCGPAGIPDRRPRHPPARRPDAQRARHDRRRRSRPCDDLDLARRCSVPSRAAGWPLPRRQRWRHVPPPPPPPASLNLPNPNATHSPPGSPH